jgi:hypothetical protein
MQVLPPKLYHPGLFADLFARFVTWIETTEGDGYLELSEPGQ